MPVISLIVAFIFAPLSHQREDDECGLDFTTVLVAKARGRIGNHVWLIMSMINYELKYGVKAFITEESRWILNEYFKGMYRLSQINLQMNFQVLQVTEIGRTSIMQKRLRELILNFRTYSGTFYYTAKTALP